MRLIRTKSKDRTDRSSCSISPSSRWARCLYNAMLENNTSELGSRMQSMENLESKNAEGDA